MTTTCFVAAGGNSAFGAGTRHVRRRPCVNTASDDAGLFWEKASSSCQASIAWRNERIWRPKLSDVERISRGESASERGVGSRAVPHRLNAEERKQYELATLQNGFLLVNGSGYRRERKGAPLVNIFRQWCDAGSVPSVRVHRDAVLDSLVCDFSTLRLRREEYVLLSGTLVQLMYTKFGVLPRAPAEGGSSDAPGAVVGARSRVLESVFTDGILDDEDRAELGSTLQELETQSEDTLKEYLEEQARPQAIWQRRPVEVAFPIERNAAKDAARSIAAVWKISEKGSKNQKTKPKTKPRTTKAPKRRNLEYDDLDGNDDDSLMDF